MEKVRTSKLVAALIAMACAFTLCFVLVGCGGDNKSNFVGDWELESMEDSQMGTIDASSLKAFGLTVTMTLNKDGSGSLTLFGESVDGTWEAKSATEMSMTLAGEGASDFKLVDGKLVGDSGGSKMIFAKVK